MNTQPWLIVAGILFGGGGIGAAYIGARSLRKVEGIKNQTALFDALAQRQNDEVLRKDAELGAAYRRIELLESEVAAFKAGPRRKKGPTNG